MNYCRTCNSDYAEPGTCNCFAPQLTNGATILSCARPSSDGQNDRIQWLADERRWAYVSDVVWFDDGDTQGMIS